MKIGLLILLAIYLMKAKSLYSYISSCKKTIIDFSSSKSHIMM